MIEQGGYVVLLERITKPSNKEWFWVGVSTKMGVCNRKNGKKYTKQAKQLEDVTFFNQLWAAGSLAT